MQKNEKSGMVALGAVFSIEKVDRDKLIYYNSNFQIRCCSPHIGLTFYKENCMDIITTFGVRGKIEPKNGPQSNECFGGLLKKRLLLSGDSKSLALLGYCYTIEGLHLIFDYQNW